jgi:uncharacterized Zn finger protein
MARKRSSYYDDYWPTYESTRPIAVDGIKAKSKSGKFVQNWWATRWIEALKDLMDSGRLSRGRSYARRGQVLEIDLKPGNIKARVQGSRSTPYKVTISLKPLEDAQWEAVFDALAAQAIFSAQLLNREMPPDIEQVFEAVNVPLFPSSSHDLETSCSCPDWANPCKHTAAVYYLLGEQFDGDPFLLFKLRGRDSDAISAALRRRRAATAAAASPAAEQAGKPSPGIEPVEVLPLTALLDDYWGTEEALADFSVQIAEPVVDLALLKRAGLPDFVDPAAFRDQMERVYHAVTERTLKVAFEE